ncbi:MAG: hypothetical protein ACFNVI_03340 [Lachnoanaerobaculum gingivalis]
MAYYKICNICGCNLDPGEACDCEEKGRENELKFKKLTKISEEVQTGQIELIEFAS